MLSDERWVALFDELRSALREVSELEPEVLDATASEDEWKVVWARYAGLLGRIGHLHQRLLARRVELLED
ncbi:MAG: hypothetical protein ACR2G8_07745 [Candidatus Limnocylindria bacterium]|nr:hypothetical protein [Chloroflexota bacterium]